MEQFGGGNVWRGKGLEGKGLEGNFSGSYVPNLLRSGYAVAQKSLVTYICGGVLEEHVPIQ
jgi:hypothetical protein